MTKLLMEAVWSPLLANAAGELRPVPDEEVRMYPRLTGLGLVLGRDMHGLEDYPKAMSHRHLRISLTHTGNTEVRVRDLRSKQGTYKVIRRIDPGSDQRPAIHRDNLWVELILCPDQERGEMLLLKAIEGDEVWRPGEQLFLGGPRTYYNQRPFPTHVRLRLEPTSSSNTGVLSVRLIVEPCQLKRLK